MGGGHALVNSRRRRSLSLLDLNVYSVNLYLRFRERSVRYQESKTQSNIKPLFSLEKNLTDAILNQHHFEQRIPQVVSMCVHE